MRTNKTSMIILLFLLVTLPTRNALKFSTVLPMSNENDGAVVFRGKGIARGGTLRVAIVASPAEGECGPSTKAHVLLLAKAQVDAFAGGICTHPSSAREVLVLNGTIPCHPVAEVTIMLQETDQYTLFVSTCDEGKGASASVGIEASFINPPSSSSRLLPLEQASLPLFFRALSTAYAVLFVSWADTLRRRKSFVGVMHSAATVALAAKLSEVVVECVLLQHLEAEGFASGTLLSAASSVRSIADFSFLATILLM